MNGLPHTPSLSGRLAILCIAATLAAGAAGWSSVSASRDVSNQAKTLVATQLPQLRAINRLRHICNQRTLLLYHYYATADQAQWQSFLGTDDTLDQVFLDFAGMQSGADRHPAIRAVARQFDEHAQRFHLEMVAAERSWDQLREHLADAQTQADRMTALLDDVADEIYADAAHGGNQTMHELSFLNRAQLTVLAVIFLTALIIMGMLRARLKDQTTLYRRAYFSDITRLPNRSRLEKDWTRRDRPGPTPATGDATEHMLLLVELDRYQMLCSTYGNEIADRVLQAISERLEIAAQETKVTFSLYHFCVATWMLVIESPPSSAESERVLNHISHAMDQVLEVENRELTVTCSGGVAFYPQHARALNDLVRFAHTALQRTGKPSHDKMIIYRSQMEAQSAAFLAMESALREGLRRKTFELHYQPKMGRAGQIVGSEALLRWRHDGEMVSPADFIPVAEESGLILDLGQRVMDEACRQWSSWRDAGLPALPIAVNVSAQQFQSPDFVSLVDASLRKHRVPAAMLELELTEAATFDDPLSVVETMRAAKAIGVSLAIDDFGTGYSSLSYLASFPLDVIKIDQAFVRDMQRSQKNLSIVQMIAALGQKMGFRIVAEGIETAAQAALLRDLGCHVFQGYLYSRPLPPKDYAAYVLEAGKGQSSGDVQNVGAAS